MSDDLYKKSMKENFPDLDDKMIEHMGNIADNFLENTVEGQHLQRLNELIIGKEIVRDCITELERLQGFFFKLMHFLIRRIRYSAFETAKI